ncbi:hypothetical protein CY34DRAFT_19810 [Suillus luteus UH-Slu-Lm8-n1]|uniref:Uncharacterized protein n=1 Tax=Suillus luteus UH-Slu-Lm8-n1 TaxID=930992 RepID=A0A0D0A072_9AGAM|nr:hypothetical protein CY34DRAFT_19810 [Suillus luteus UH-Slu-Lm8-n1]
MSITYLSHSQTLKVQQRNKVRRFLTKVKDGLMILVVAQIPCSSSCSRDPILQNTDPEDASLVLNVELEDVPAGDGYFMICMNFTVGRTYYVSSRFSVTDANATESNLSSASAPIVTVRIYLQTFL